MWRRLKKLARRLANEHTTPARLGWAVGIGIMIGVTPFYGFHLLIVFVVATLLRLNRIITYAAAHISLPMFVPFLAYGSIQLGHRALHDSWLDLTVEALWQMDPWEFGYAWLLGSPLLGLLIGVPCGLLAWAITRLYRRRHPLPADPIRDAMARVAQRYRPFGRFAFGYVQGKLEHDPVYYQLAQRLPMPMPLIDVGCGRGQTGLLIAKLQPDVVVQGFDWDKNKVTQATAAADGRANFRYWQADIRREPIPEGAGTILMLDVLHYNGVRAQDRMLARAAEALRPGGRLYVRDLDAAAGFKARTTIWQERVARWIGLNRGAMLCFRSAADLTATLEKLGLRTEIVRSSGDLPLANVLIAAEKPT